MFVREGLGYVVSRGRHPGRLQQDRAEGGQAVKLQDLRDLWVDELKDLYHAEHQILKALPKMAKAAVDDELRTAFEEHLEQTRGHVERLEQVFEQIGEAPKGKRCKGMEGIIAEGKEMIDLDLPEPVGDAALIAAAQRVEHYEIAAYGTVRTYAELLGEGDAATLLEETLNEEKETDERLTAIAESVNPEAAEPEESDDDDRSRNGNRKKSRQPVGAGR
jgi:ferritin-like metal-binding protein YciE